MSTEQRSYTSSPRRTSTGDQFVTRFTREPVHGPVAADGSFHSERPSKSGGGKGGQRTSASSSRSARGQKQGKTSAPRAPRAAGGKQGGGQRSSASRPSASGSARGGFSQSRGKQGGGKQGGSRGQSQGRGGKQQGGGKQSGGKNFTARRVEIQSGKRGLQVRANPRGGFNREFFEDKAYVAGGAAIASAAITFAYDKANKMVAEDASKGVGKFLAENPKVKEGAPLLLVAGLGVLAAMKGGNPMLVRVGDKVCDGAIAIGVHQYVGPKTLEMLAAAPGATAPAATTPVSPAAPATTPGLFGFFDPNQTKGILSDPGSTQGQWMGRGTNGWQTYGQGAMPMIRGRI